MRVLHRRVRRPFSLVEADQARVEAEHDRKVNDHQRLYLLPHKRIKKFAIRLYGAVKRWGAVRSGERWKMIKAVQNPIHDVYLLTK